MRSLRLLLLTAAGLFAQLDRGTVTGTVTDSTGGVVPQVMLRFTHSGTGAVYETRTNEVGQYSRPNLPIGEYQLTVEAAGFKKTVRSGITLGISEVLRVDVSLEIGSTGESVTVTAELPRLQTDTPQIGTSLAAKSLTTLPLSFSGGRQAESFAYMITPGVSGGTFESHVNGSITFSKETLVEGASVTVNQGGDFAPMAVSVEALAGSAVPDRRHVGGVRPHARRRIQLRDEIGHQPDPRLGVRRASQRRLNANTFANKARGAERAPDRKHNFALSFGGPVYIPKIYDGRNKTFFYTSYERYKERNYGFSSPNRTAPIPDFYEGELQPAAGSGDRWRRPMLSDVRCSAARSTTPTLSGR